MRSFVEPLAVAKRLIPIPTNTRYHADRNSMKSGLLAVFSVCLALGALTTASAAQDTNATQNGTLRVFLDCNFCRRNLSHFRREVSFVNYVRDRQDAAVHILGTRQSAGAGTEY